MSLLDTASLVITPNGTKASKLYSVVPSDGSGDMTVTRATTATRVNSAGLIESVASNVPRLDYSNGTCPSILVEPQRTNLLNQSQNFSSSCWVSASGVTVTNNTRVAPDGTMTADTIAGTLAGNKVYYESSSFPTIPANSNTVTGSVYVYATSAITIILNIYEWAGAETSQSFTLTPNTWQRLVYTKTFSGGSGNVGLSIQTDAQTVFVWGAQLELGSYATSYIPTTSSSVTRNADVINKTGISSLIGQTEGTLFVDFYHDGSQNYNLSSISNGLYDDAVFFEMYLGNMYGVIWDSGSQQFLYNGGSLSVGRHKMAIGYKANDVVFYIDGVLKTTDTSATIPTTARVDVGSLANATIEKTQNNLTALWKTRLTNTQLAQLTTI